MSKMVEVVIDSVRVSLTNQQRIVVLREINAERYLPIWIGPYEAEAITIALQEIEVSRPQTHDLLKNILTGLNARLIRVEILALRDDVFYARLVLEVNNQEIEIDSRPSDALALAARAHATIFIAEEVLDQAGIIPESDIQNQEQTPASKTEPAPQEVSPERLSIFEDFLSNIDMGGFEDSDEDSSQEQDDDQPDKDSKK